MKIKKDKEGKFKVESSAKGRFYTVDIAAQSCTCAHFMFRLARQGGKCKHILAVGEKFGKESGKRKLPQKSVLSFSRILEEARKKGEIETVVLIEKYSEDEVQELIDNGELIEKGGKVRAVK